MSAGLETLDVFGPICPLEWLMSFRLEREEGGEKFLSYHLICFHEPEGVRLRHLRVLYEVTSYAPCNFDLLGTPKARP